MSLYNSMSDVGPDCTSLRGRTLTMTEKGAAYQADEQNRILDQIFKAQKKRMNSIQSMLANNSDTTAIQIEFDAWTASHLDFTQKHKSSVAFLPPEDLQVNKARLTELANFKTVTQNNLVFREIRPQDSVSQAPSRRTSQSSRASRLSSSLAKVRLQELENSAALSAQRATLERRQQLEASQLQLKQQIASHDLETDILTAKIKSELLRDIEDGDKSHLSVVTKATSIANSLVRPPPAATTDGNLQQDNCPRQPPAATTDGNPQQDNRPRQPPAATTDGNPQQDNRPRPPPAAETRQQVIYVSKDELPAKEPSVFKGDVFDFPRWLQAFETLVEKRKPDPRDRLYYLGIYTSGPPHEALEGYLFLDSPEAYTEAKLTLIDRFGNKMMVSESYKTKLNKWPTLRNASGPELRNFVDYMKACKTAMSTIGFLSTLDSMEENKKILAKLPRYIVNKWNREVDKRMYGNSSGAREPTFPRFSEFVDFMTQEVRLANSILVTDKEEDSAKKKKDENFHGNYSNRNSKKPYEGSSGARSYSSGAKVQQCTVCSDSHHVDRCKQFEAMSLAERQNVVKSKYLCFGCLKSGHSKRRCFNKLTCAKCSGLHPTLLHDEDFKANVLDVKAKVFHVEAIGESNTPKNYCLKCTDSNLQSLIMPVEMYHADNPHIKTCMYAMIDEQSDACFVTNNALDKLNVTGIPVELRLATIQGEVLTTSSKVTGLVVQGLKDTTEITLPGCYTREKITTNEQQVPRPDKVRRWSHLERVADQLLPYDNTLEVGLLIGINCVRATRPREVISGNEDEPYAIKTALGWGVVGTIDRNVCEDLQHFDSRSHFAYKTKTTEVTAEQIRKMFDLGFEDVSQETTSAEDRQFMKIVTDGIHYTDEGHFELPLPIKGEMLLPNNKQLAEKRLNGLRRRLLQQGKLRSDYKSFMADLIGKGYAERVPDEPADPGKVWYIPHHAVYHKTKQKIRIVFDCSAEYGETSLNSHLLPGPDFINNLTGILCRFREEKYAVTCDIESMFHQVGVNKEHRNLLRFLWWEDDNMEIPQEFRMTVHLFGARSSPGCVGFALRSTANVFEKEFGQASADFIRRDFYVDDGLKSTANITETKDLILTAQQHCKKGGFRLHKFASNTKEVLKAIPQADRAKGIQDIDLSCEELPIERTLGIQWSIELDAFQFRVDFKDRPLTRRGILSTVSSIYDPLGLLSPVILIGKRILQDICKSGADWDDPIPDDIRFKWLKWRSEVQDLTKMNIQRCYKPKDFGVIKSAELHHFSDASLTGLGQCSYLRLQDEHDHISTSLVMSKSRVPPCKVMTVPRLELAAAVMSVRVSSILSHQLTYKGLKHFYWTDSRIVIGYIQNDARRFHIFVANRVQEIRNSTNPSDWKHVGTKQNPADLASRGSSPQELIAEDKWWHGPDFLRSGNPLPTAELPRDIEDDDPEVRKVKVLSTQIKESTEPISLLERIDRFSNWEQAKTAIACCMRYKDILKQQTKPKEKRKKLTPISIQEKQQAEELILLAVQERHFNRELKVLTKKRTKRERSLKGTTLDRLDPFLDERGLIRVGGRIRRSNLPREVMHPVVLPKKCHVTQLIIEHFHQRLGHAGRGLTLNATRAHGYWIIAAGSTVTSHIWKCVTCRKLRRNPQGQKMADLPEDRLEPAPPFTYTGVDLFGPFLVKEGRTERKRYGVVFTCLSSRAIHLEVTHSMSTDSFINAYRRFICRRGPVRVLRSDRGTNFIGAKGEQAAALSQLNNNKIRQDLAKDNCDWVEYKMNVPHASHMGGVWERMIRSARNALSGLLTQHGDRLNDESLQTLFAEAEAIVNSRPLTRVDTKSTDSLTPLSPSQILTFKANVVMPPPGNFIREDLYCHRQWRRVQHLANEFWLRWRREFLPTLQERKKWTKIHRDIQLDDIVLMVDDNLPRNQWLLARVLETHQGKDGLVRSVRLQTATSTFERPIHKLVLILETADKEQN